MAGLSLMLAIAVVAGMGLFVKATGQEFTAADWARADSLVVRLPPSAFPKLPAALRRALVKRGCTIPQSFLSDAPHNVIHGGFLGPGGRDWAVLCSCKGESRILLFRDGLAPAADSLMARRDSEFLQHVGGGRIAYSRAIALASAKEARMYLVHIPPDTLWTHDGIQELFLGKGSEIHYWVDHRWWTMARSD